MFSMMFPFLSDSLMVLVLISPYPDSGSRILKRRPKPPTVLSACTNTDVRTSRGGRHDQTGIYNADSRLRSYGMRMHNPSAFTFRPHLAPPRHIA